MQTRHTVKTILRLEALPTLPAVIHRILAITGDPMSSMKELAAEVERDPALSANLLRLVNSAYFGFSRKITAIQDAGVLLGCQSIRTMALGTSLVTSMNVNGLDCRRFWGHSLATAITTSRLAQSFRHENADLSFIAGLLHDLGILLLAVSMPDKAEKAFQLGDDALPLDLDQEADMFGISHDQAGGHVSRHWKFDPILTRAIEEHAVTSPRLAERHPLGRLVMLAEWVLGDRYRMASDTVLTDAQATEVAVSMGYPIAMVRDAAEGLDKALGIIEPLLSIRDPDS